MLLNRMQTGIIHRKRLEKFLATFTSNALRQSSESGTSKIAALTDLFQRQHTYLRISLSEKCNLRCRYCMPEEGVKLTEHDKILTSDEIIYLSKIFVSQGINKIRLTGGEPTVRKDLVSIIENLKNIDGLNSIAMTTNGLTLTRQLVALQKAGLDVLNVSLDTMKPDRFEFITRRNVWKKAIMGIDLALQLGYNPVKINCVLMRGFNDDEIIDFVKYTQDRNVDIRFIEYMPFSGNKWEQNKMIPYEEILKIIKEEFPNFKPLTNGPNDTSKAWKVPNFKGQVGFITSMSNHFCGTCNRLRITADGNLKVCLFGNTEVSLRDAIRNGCNKNDLVSLISAAVKRKKKQHAEPYQLKHTKLYAQHTLLFPINYKTTFSQLRLYSSTSPPSHIDDEGKAKMVDVTEKNITVRTATARGIVRVTYTISDLLKDVLAKKGDVLTVAQLAGIMGAKKTSELIPLCHNISLTNVNVEVKLNYERKQIEITAEARAASQTGVEMEALTAVSIAALTVYDMCKSVSYDITIGNISLVKKSGGRSDFQGQTVISVKQPKIQKYESEEIRIGPI